MVEFVLTLPPVDEHEVAAASVGDCEEPDVSVALRHVYVVPPSGAPALTLS